MRGSRGAATRSSAGLLPGLEGQQQPLREIAPLVVGLAKHAGHGGDHVRTRQHVTGHREHVAQLVAAPRHTAAAGMAKRALGIQAVYLPDLALAVLPEQRTQGDVDRDPL
jgi:hypothetical protein